MRSCNAVPLLSKADELSNVPQSPCHRRTCRPSHTWHPQHHAHPYTRQSRSPLDDCRTTCGYDKHAISTDETSTRPLKDIRRHKKIIVQPPSKIAAVHSLQALIACMAASNHFVSTGSSCTCCAWPLEVARANCNEIVLLDLLDGQTALTDHRAAWLPSSDWAA